MKSQSAIISTVLLSGIILAIVAATYIWGQPLVQKTTDKIKVDTLTELLENIKNSVDNAQQSGSPAQMQLDITDANIVIEEANNGVKIETRTTIPIITSFTYVPISYTELPFENELIDVNTSGINVTPTYTPSEYTIGTTIHFGSTTLRSSVYNVTTYYTGDAFDIACIYQGQSATSADCISEGGSVTKNSIGYTLSWINALGTEIILTGPQSENVGVLGTDPGGIIVGRSTPVSRLQQVELSLIYRGLVDSSGRITKTVIECASGCRSGEGRKILRISRDRVERLENITYFYIKMQFE